MLVSYLRVGGLTKKLQERNDLIKILQEQIKTNLNSKMRIGESRHKAKNEVREERKAQGKDLSAVNIRVDTIHSINTYKTYLEHCTHFVEWCINEKGVNKYASLNKIEKYAKEYLQYREEKLTNDKLIGRFGVGLKDALATLYRHGIKVQIISKYGVRR